MASKTGTSDNGHGQIPDSWIMAYNPDIVAGVWVGNTGPNGGGGTIRAFGESVGQTIMARFVNGLPGKMRSWYSQPSGIQHGCGSDPSEIFLSGSCASPTASTPTASPSGSPSPTGLPSPSLPPTPTPLPSPLPSPTPPVGSPKPTPT